MDRAQGTHGPMGKLPPRLDAASIESGAAHVERSRVGLSRESTKSIECSEPNGHGRTSSRPGHHPLGRARLDRHWKIERDERAGARPAHDVSLSEELLIR